jgi:hypothetical protein
MDTAAEGREVGEGTLAAIKKSFEDGRQASLFVRRDGNGAMEVSTNMPV